MTRLLPCFFVIGVAAGAVACGGGGVVGEGEGEGEGEGQLALHEVSCRGDDFVEVKNTGAVDVDLAAFSVSESDGRAVVLEGRLPPGGLRAVALPGIACDDDDVTLRRGDVELERVHPPLLPAGATFGRLDDDIFTITRATPGQENAAFVDEAGRLFTPLDAPVPTTLPALRLTLAPAAEAALRADGGTYIPATLTFVDDVGTVTVPTGVRIKGQSVLRSLDQKAAFRLDLDRFVAGGHLFGVEQLVLNNLVQDNSASRERLYYGLAERRGLPASRSGYVEVFVNEVFFGVYLALEGTADEGFLGRAFSSTQLLYEGEYGQDLFIGNEPQFDEDYGDDPERLVLRGITADLDGAAGATLMADTTDTIAWERLVPQMAFDVFCGHWDSYAPTKNNFTFHIDDDGRLSLISGGADQAFDPAHTVTVDNAQGRLFLRCREDPACAAAIDAALVDIAGDVAAWLDAGGSDRLVADGLLLEGHLADDARREWDHRQIPTLVDGLIAFVRGRVAVFAP